MAQPPPPRNYSDLCTNPKVTGLAGSGAYRQVITKAYSRWTAAGNQTLSNDELLTEILCNLGATKMVGGILAFVAMPEHPEGVAQVVHNVREYRGHGPFRQAVFAYVGDVQEFDIEVTKFSTSILDPVSTVDVYKDIDKHL